VRQHGLGHEERARQVERITLCQVLVGHLQHGLVDRDPRVVDQDVEPAVLFDHLGDRAPAVIRRADVALVGAAVQALVREPADERDSVVQTGTSHGCFDWTAGDGHLLS
jgi:hypothetical protein